MWRSVLCWGFCISVEHNTETPANTLRVKGPAPATGQSYSGDLERQESVGCFTYIGLTSKKPKHFRSTACYPQPPRPGSPVGGTAIAASLGCCKVTWLAGDLGRQQELLQHVPGESRREQSQECQAGRVSAGRDALPSKGRLGGSCRQ